MVVRISTLRSGHALTQKDILILSSISVSVNCRIIVLPQEFGNDDDDDDNNNNNDINGNRIIFEECYKLHFLEKFRFKRQPENIIPVSLSPQRSHKVQFLFSKY
jgi:hypothetical protein